MAPDAAPARAPRGVALAALLAAFAAAPAGCGGGPSCAAIDECESSMSFRLAPLSSLLREAGGAPLALRACVDEVCGEAILRPDGGCAGYRGALRSCEVWGPEGPERPEPRAIGGPERPEPRAIGGPDEASTLVLGLRLGGRSRSWQGVHTAALTVQRADGEAVIEAQREIELLALRPPIEGCSGAVCWAGPSFAIEVP
ncbi:MAG TPA: hypothetical protein VFS43_40245 [Polyangiaceae bacterium]|nr:hypothetical protein [Polyangiaceae bacterium]